MAQKVPLLVDRPAHESANNAGNDFEGGAYWQLIDPEGSELDEYFMEVEGIRFRAPTTTEEEHNANHPDRPKKRNYSQMFDLMPFVSERLLPENNQRGRFKKNNKGEFQYKKQLTTSTVTNI